MKQRKITVKFFSEAEIERLSNKLLKNTEQELTKNVREISITDKTGNKDINELAFKIQYKKPVFQQPRELKEWEYHWKDLTPFYISPTKAIGTMDMYFPDFISNVQLAEIFEQTITDKTKSIQFPKAEESSVNVKRYIGTRGNPMYPIYIISKGRAHTCATADHLIKMQVPFRIVIEKQEWEEYKKYYDESILLELDLSFRGEYDTYIENFDVNKSKGSGPARNFVWNHAKESGAKFHWIMDDNIFGFNYYYDNQRIKAVDGTIFAAAEDFVNRYENIGIAGLNYYMFAVPGSKDKPYVANTKIYSCLLIRNDISVRWAGRYNEDVDVCIRALKEGYSTIQFDAFLAKKGATQTMGGGNTDAFYAEEGTLPKSNMLMNNHPDITEVTWRFQRWHHITNYDIFDYYKDRTLKETIQDMMKQQILDKEIHKEALEQISKIDFSRIKKWNILKNCNISEAKRKEVLDVLKFNRYKKNTAEILDILTRPRLINPDLDAYLLDNDIPDTLDNKIMLDIFKLGNERGILFNNINFDEYFSYIPEERRKYIIKELIRNKYLQVPYDKHEYNIKEVKLTQEDHLLHKDSKPYIENILYGTDKPEIVTNFDKKMRKEITVESKPKFESKLTARGKIIKKEHDGRTLMVAGDEIFDNEELFEEKCSIFIKEHNIDEIINSVYYKVDLMSANFALDNKLKSREFVPDLILHGNGAYIEMYKHMAEYTDICLIFVNERLTKDLEFLKNQLEINNKQYIIIQNKQIQEDW